MNDIGFRETLLAQPTSLTLDHSNDINGILHKFLPQIVIPNPRTGEWQVVASAITGKGVDEQYATPFMRDTAKFMLGLLDSVENGKSEDEIYLQRAIEALREIETYQADADDPEAGIKIGQMPHELRFPFLDKNHEIPNPKFQHFIEEKWKIFQRTVNDVKEEYIASYDSSEATHLYVLTVMRLEQKYPGFILKDGREKRVKRACEYILQNSREHNYLAGFVNDLPWEYLALEKEAYGGLSEMFSPNLPNSIRKYRGAAFRGIRDQGDQCFANGLKPMPGYPISDLQTTAIKFAAELMAADYYDTVGNIGYASVLRNDAKLTKQNFNSESMGFLRRDAQGRPYFVEARGINPETGQNEQLPYKTGSPLYALAYPYYSRDESGQSSPVCVIDDKYIPDVARLIVEDLYQPGFGISTYSRHDFIPSPKGIEPTNYWISQGTTFWGVEQYLAANGLLNFGYTNEAFEIAQNANALVHRFQSPIENWIKTPNNDLARWRHPYTGWQQEAGNAMAFVVGPALGFWAKFERLAPSIQPALLRRNVLPTASMI